MRRIIEKTGVNSIHWLYLSVGGNRELSGAKQGMRRLIHFANRLKIVVIWDVFALRRDWIARWWDANAFARDSTAWRWVTCVAGRDTSVVSRVGGAALRDAVEYWRLLSAPDVEQIDAHAPRALIAGTRPADASPSSAVRPFHPIRRRRVAPGRRKDAFAWRVLKACSG